MNESGLDDLAHVCFVFDTQRTREIVSQWRGLERQQGSVCIPMLRR